MISLDPSLRSSDLSTVKNIEDKSEAQMIWGLTVSELHDAWWSGQGVQVVHRNSQFKLAKGAEVFLLLPKDWIVVFSLGEVVEELVWSTTKVTAISVSNRDKDRYREEVRRSANGEVVGIARSYDFCERTRLSALFTTDSAVAADWAMSESAESKIDGVSFYIKQNFEADLTGHSYDLRRSDEKDRFLRSLVATWPDPWRVLRGIEEVSNGIAAPKGTKIPEGIVALPPVWIGFDLAEDGETILAGPEFRRDGLARNSVIKEKVEARDISAIAIPGGGQRKRLLPRRTFYGIIKRVTDCFVALTAVILFLPLFLVLAIVIVLNDGFPLFFAHKRQARGGREFKCYKFRTMRRDAESMVKELQALNKADGPQVFIENDPRVTRVGAFMRKFQLDELPQFWNVIKGDMSFVGPRPSPDRENQFCPAWRELRLSVRPGITGLWQVNRTRAPGEDFQEWIRYDIEYVRTASFIGDLKIIFRTVRGIILRG